MTSYRATAQNCIGCMFIKALILYYSSKIQRRLSQSGRKKLIHFFSKIRLDEDFLFIDRLFQNIPSRELGMP